MTGSFLLDWLQKYFFKAWYDKENTLSKILLVINLFVTIIVVNYRKCKRYSWKMYSATCEVIVFYAFACFPWTFNVANLFRFIPLFTIQGVPIEYYQKWIALWQLKVCTCTFMLVKPKCVCEAVFFFFFFLKNIW